MFKCMISALLLTLLAGCSSSFNSVSQVNNESFLQLEGAFLNAELTIDDTKISLSENNITTFKLDGKIVAKFPIVTGKHQVTITKEDKVIVKRVFFTANGETFKVQVQQ